ncbi:hypothetical protein QT711_11350 [Sporosarcina saromensis]|uniref:DUF6877 domain-containing protein n=2 Tax=Sporosarcina saromensis TaxID=359365 RepID=A0ABU4G9X6_9BACL|nr:hypothetical protein [Sporosarcina saromensis]
MANNPIQEIAKIAHHIPLVALQDINNRIRDHLASGGKDDDPYIFQQLRYARKFVKEDAG